MNSSPTCLFFTNGLSPLPSLPRCNHLFLVNLLPLPHVKTTLLSFHAKITATISFPLITLPHISLNSPPLLHQFLPPLKWAGLKAAVPLLLLLPICTGRHSLLLMQKRKKKACAARASLRKERVFVTQWLHTTASCHDIQTTHTNKDRRL